ncbi:MAG: hypothetical protein Q7T81_02065 [Pseudolabrys sp.]|nr:hypothetical protein [Pseudolabrys sp.]
MADWSVKIAVVNGATVFQTQLQPGNSSTTYMAPGDTLSWNNQTKETLQPALSVAGTQVFQTDPIHPDYSSTPAWVAPKPPQTYAVSAALCDGGTVNGSIIVS